MLKKLSVIAFSALLMASNASAQANADVDYRDFTGPNGKIIQAVVMDKVGDKVTLLLRNGSRTTVEISKLGPVDQVYVNAWSKEKAVFLEKCRSLTISQLLELRGYEAFTFKFRGNSIMMDGKVNGKPGTFLIDTGAGMSMLHLAYAQSVGCEIGPMDQRVSGIAGDAPAALTEMKSIAFGESVFNGLECTVYDFALGLQKGQPVDKDGIFGADLMSQLDAVISYPERKIFLHPDNVLEAEKAKEFTSFRLFRTKDNATYRGKVTSKTPTVATLTLQDGKTMQIPISRLVDDDAKYANEWTEAAAFFLEYCQSISVEELLALRQYQSFVYERIGNHIYVDGGLNENPVRYMIDTGAETTCLNFESAKAYNCEFGPLNAESVYGIGGKAPATSTLIKKLTMGDALLTNRKVLSVDMQKFRGEEDLSYVGIFGADFLRELDAVITYKDKRIFLLQRGIAPPVTTAPEKKK